MSLAKEKPAESCVQGNFGIVGRAKTKWLKISITELHARNGDELIYNVKSLNMDGDMFLWDRGVVQWSLEMTLLQL